MTSSPVRNHNKGPIGPLDPSEPPAFPYDNLQGHHRLTIAEATRALRSKGVDQGSRRRALHR
jgi:hypothetical protein